MGLLLKERICFQQQQILFFKSRSILEEFIYKGSKFTSAKVVSSESGDRKLLANISLPLNGIFALEEYNRTASTVCTHTCTLVIDRV